VLRNACTSSRGIGAGFTSSPKGYQSGAAESASGRHQANISRTGSPRDRIAARWRANRLDLTLAAGVPAEASPALFIRARRLTALPRRRLIADGLRRAIGEAREQADDSRFRVRPSQSRVAAARDELSRLADALAQTGPVAAQGVAQAWQLLVDGTGPLYNVRNRASLRTLAASASEHLRLRDS
jgi:hypothetical protein